MRLLMICLAFASALAEAGVRRLRSAGAGEFARGRRILLGRWDIEILPAMTIRIPVDLARGLEGIAAAQQKSVQELAVGRLRSFVDRSPLNVVLLRTIQALPHPSREAMDDLDSVVAASRLTAT